MAIFIILMGAVIRIVGPSMGKSNAAGSAKLAGYGFMFAGVLLALSNAVTVISVGEVGVLHFLGKVDPTPLQEGVHIVNPLADIEKMSVREQAFPEGGGVEVIEAQTSEQLNVRLEIAILFRIDGLTAPDLYRRLGSEATIKRGIVLNAMRNGVRDAIAAKSISEIFSPDRRELATEIIQQRALQAIEEAKGIAEAQKIISAGLTPAYLTFHYIEKLAELPPGSVVYVPTEGGVPLMRMIGGGGN